MRDNGTAGEQAGQQQTFSPPADGDADAAAYLELFDAPAQEAAPNATTAASEIEFPGYVIGVGASAGGLEALERMFEPMPTDLDAAFVVVQHLSPDHKSLMASLLARHTRMPVTMVEDDMRIVAGNVYLIPPGAMMTAAKGRLRLMPKSPHGLSLPIDLFFSSLAASFGARAIGVILSGTGSDGARGSVAINDAGGLLLAQSPESAKFDGMPRSVIATGLVDEILAAEEMGQRILEHIRQPLSPSSRDSARVPPPAERGNSLEEILHLLRNFGGINFHEYKPATVLRRIERRMQVRHTPDFEQYLHLLEGERGEAALLQREILIPVTSFFRDPESFEELARTAVARIVADHADTQAIRIWVAGVSTGEEAYSIAILFAEEFERVRRWPNFKIFATDVAQQNIDAASAGVFSEAIIAEVSPQRLERFFTKKGGHFAVNPEIRQNIVFARHNLLEDPPFTRMDLITCRNMLIYFLPSAQERALRRMHYALAPGGFLFLGSSESLSALNQDFTATSSKHKLFCVLRHASLPIELGDVGTRGRHNADAANLRRPLLGIPGRSSDSQAIDAAQNLLLSAHAPPSLLLSEKRELTHIFGGAQRYLQFPQGQVSLDALRLLPAQLVPVAQALVHRAQKDGKSICSEPANFSLADDSVERLRLLVRPLPRENGLGPYLLLSFEVVPVSPAPGSAEGMRALDLDVETVERVSAMERELAATREGLQAAIEELETSNEELQATNEELMASNEELQSSNEELQSLNEELYTVNAENQEKIQILNRLNADLDSMAMAGGIPTVFLDDERKITRFTPQVKNIFNIRDGDIGRPLADFTHTLDYPTLASDLHTCVASARTLEKEVRGGGGKLYLVKIVPYAALAPRSRGAVIAFIDVTSLHDMRRLQAILDALPQQVAVVDRDGMIRLINSSWRDFAKHNGDPRLLRSGPGSRYPASLRASRDADSATGERIAAGLDSVLAGELPRFSLEYTAPGGNSRFLMQAVPLDSPEGGAIVSHIDVSTWGPCNG
ncbi:chemotaxis protein CheB [Rhodocyclus tenuis]|uniref:protein-glutamate O-methyltransferase n=1 Tax=Rhodocyclus tenuis TaxID=1066 RepID=A0A840G0B1_RHOTE|nr:chemotaxis protein CheB [Rhodocyclus tenuis]MBB4247614.1 two-component system CheB/CheR fusion protein [Rhodocyclus tenuis]